MNKFYKRWWLPAIVIAAMPTAVNAADLPWNETFDTKDSFSAFTVLNENGDEEQWKWNYRGCARMSYNKELAMDDWLITPGFQLEAGATYKFSLDAMRSVGTERLEVFAGMGGGKNAADFTTPIIQKTDIKDSKYVTLTGEFSVSESGEWFIGIHGCSDANEQYLFVDNLSLIKGVVNSSPEAIADFKATPDPSGLAKVTISGTLPTKDISGGTLTGIDKVEVICDKDIVYTSGKLTPGEKFQWTHENAPLKQHTYTAVVYSGDARGKEASAEVYVGPNIPGTVLNPQVGEFTPGEVTLRWEAPKTDVNGNPINPELIKYKVVGFDILDNSAFVEEDIEGADEITQTEFVHKAIEPGNGQIFVAYGVYAYTSAGKSKRVTTPLFPVGDNYKAPWKESFANGESSTLFRSEIIKNYAVVPSWDAFSDKDSDVKARDNDSGYLAMMGENENDCARFYSGKIDLSELKRPALSFYVYNYTSGGKADDNLLEVYACVAPPFLFQKEIKISELPAKGWNKVIIPLDDFAGKTLQFAFQGTTKTHMATPVDCITIGDLTDVDLEAVSVAAPAKVIAGQDFTITAKIENGGAAATGKYKVELYRDNKLLDEIEPESLASCGISEVKFTDNISVFDKDVEKVAYHIAITAEGDANTGNNTSAEITVTVESPSYPTPANLTGSIDGNSVSLSWSAPDLSTVAPESTTDGFESYESFANTNVGGWIFKDADGQLAGKFEGVTFPGVNDNPAGTVTSFWVMDAQHEGLNASFAAHAGNKYIAQIYNADNSACDDWAISPELYAGGQQISFYAKSYSSYSTLAESMEVYYSEGGTEISDFKLIENVEEVPNVWTLMEYQLPAGAKRFAIRCTSIGKFMLMIDDATYTPANGKASLQLSGYNVYRDGAKLNESVVADASYEDKSVADGTHSYMVTAVYDKGESLPTDEYTTEVAGIGSASGNAIEIAGGHGEISLRGISNSAVAIYTPDGKLVYAYENCNDCRIEIPAGIYIVKAGQTVEKVRVK